MNVFDELGRGLGRAWESIAEGWRHLQERAGDALTRFHPVRAGKDVESPEDRIAFGGPRFGVLAAEVSEADDDVLVRIEVPGMEPGDFELDVRDDVLRISGEKRVSRDRRDGGYHVMERAYGRFVRTIPMPCQVDDSRAEARYRRGVLEITLPKHTVAAARRIEVEQG